MRLVACSLVSAIVHYFWQCSLFRVWWSLKWEMLWIFRVEIGTLSHMTEAWKRTKALLFAMVSELHPLRFELQIWLSCLPWASLQTLDLWRFKLEILLLVTLWAPLQNLIFRRGHFWFRILFILFLSEKQNKNKNCWIYKNNVSANWEKYKVSWNLFGVYYWFLNLYAEIISHSYFPSHGIS